MRLPRWLENHLFDLAIANANRAYEKEASKLPEYLVGSVRIRGAPTFTAEVKEALSQLKSEYPYGYSLVQRYISAIVESSIDPSKGTVGKIIYRRSQSDGALGVPVNWFAAALVRRAAAIRKLLGFRIWRSRRSAIASLKQELHAMRALKCDPKYFHQQTNKILQLERELREKGC